MRHVSKRVMPIDSDIDFVPEYDADYSFDQGEEVEGGAAEFDNESNSDTGAGGNASTSTFAKSESEKLRVEGVSQKIELVSKMLNLDSRHRPSASQILQHMWISNRDHLPSHRLALQDAHLIKGALTATFRAVHESPKAPNLGPVAASALARRRGKSRPKSSSEV
ncbi:unnamed protein product [Darwinula stevensoni]|uniref:Uncharacterized protein n=1 Tax=Darwinula stevensoni TaxID=69355 RepID=A0A7R8XI68_9CRUS|nr:unnamed protein product [Darwinula stevensoni]CAG0894066.1 unnamed protein product [Darwinula stevensoni]